MRGDIYSIKVEGDISSDKQVYIAPMDTSINGANFYMKDQSIKNPKSDVLANVTSSKQYWDFKDVANGVEANDNNIIAMGLTAGNWRGNLNFVINLHDYIPKEGFNLSVSNDVFLSANSSIQINAYKDGEIVTNQVTWESDNSNIRVDNGNITTSANVKVGDTATITATMLNDMQFKNSFLETRFLNPNNEDSIYKATLKVMIFDINLSQNVINIIPGESVTITANVLPLEVNGIVNWSTTATDGLSIYKNGNVVTINTSSNMIIGSTYYLIATYKDLSKVVRINIVNPHVHSYIGVVTKEPTYTETGIMTYTCVDGDDSYIEEIPMISAKNILTIGKDFNAKIKQLVNTSATHTTSNTTITSIELTDVAPTTQTSVNVGVSDIETILAYLDGTIIKIYTNEKTLICSEDSSYMFSNFRALININILNNLDTYNVTDMSYMFQDCGYTSMNSLDLGDNFNTSNVINMRSMFSGCGFTSMTSLNLGDNFDTSKVTNMSNMFNSCGYSSMTSLDLGENFNTSNVTDMNNMFYCCGYTKMTSLDLGYNFDTSNVTTMRTMFINCGYTSMTSLNLRDKYDIII